MENITSVTELRNAISQLEYNREVHRQVLRRSFDETMESFKPANVLKNISEAFTSPSLLSNIIPAALGLGAGYLTDKIISGSTGGRLPRILMSAALFGITKILAKNPGINRVIGQRVMHNFFSKAV